MSMFTGPAAPHALSVSSTGPTSAYVSWLHNHPGGNNFTVHTNKNCEGTEQHSMNLSVGSLNHHLNELSPFTLYCIHVTALDLFFRVPSLSSDTVVVKTGESGEPISDNNNPILTLIM